jgi:hypothetical protein
MGVEARAAMVGFSLFIPQLEKSEPLVPSDGYEVTCLYGLDHKKGELGKVGGTDIPVVATISCLLLL